MDKKRIANSFSNAAKTYDQHAQLQRDVCDQLLNQFKAFNVNQILDIGCGTGYGVKCLNQQFNSDIYAIDLAPKMIEFAQQAVPFANYQCADAESLPFENSQFDLIISSLALQWLENIENVMSEISRCLSENGQAWIATLGEKTLFELKQAWKEVDDQVHVNNFHNIHMWQEGVDKLGLKLEVVEKEVILEYSNVLELARDL